MALLVIAFSLISAPWTSSSPNSVSLHEAANPEWRVDLRPAIGSPPVRSIAQRRSEFLAKPYASVWFINNNTIATTFVVRKTGSEPQVSNRKGLDNNLPLQLRAIFLDAQTGKVKGNANWPTDSRRSLIIAVDEGKFVTLRGRNLTLYSPDAVALKDLTLPATDFAGWLWCPSPTGKNILFFSSQFGKSSLIWINTDTLKVIDSWEDDLNGYLSISDKYVATSTCWSGFEVKSVTYNDNGGATISPGSKCDSEIKIRSPLTGWKTIAPGEPHQYPQFVNENMLFVPGKTIGRIIGIDGKVLFEQPRIHQSFGCWGSGVFPVPDGRRFVIPSCELKGAMPTFDIGGHLALKQVAIYDISSQMQSYKIDVKGPSIKNQMEFAVSPDGSKLAVLNNEFVEVFQLPPSS